MSDSLTYDVFLSHSSKDKAAVRELAERLRADGLRVWFDEWVIKPGDLVGLIIEKGLDASRTLVLAMSAQAFSSEWVTLERQTALFRDPTNSQRRFIPVRLDSAPIASTLKQFAYVDWRDKTDREYKRLLEACKAHVLAGEPGTKEVATFRESTLIKGSGTALRAAEAVAITADGLWAVVPNEINIRIWNLSSQRCVRILDGHRRQIKSLLLTGNGNRIISGSRDHTVRVWDWDSGRCIQTLSGHGADITCTAATPDGRIVVSGSLNPIVKCWDVESGACIHTLAGHTNSVHDVVVMSNGNYALSCSADGTIRLWDLITAECLHVFEGHTGAVCSVAVSADGSIFVSGSLDNTLKLWDLKARKCMATLEGHTGSVYRVALTEDGRWAASASIDTTIKIWDVGSGTCTTTLAGHYGSPGAMAMTPDGQRIAYVARDNTILLWEPQLSKATRFEADVTRYTNAKVLLVGESGVGKTGLAMRLTQDHFEPTVSTDGAWATQLKLPHALNDRNLEQEIWLWDFAGQADYRLIHQLFMDETALAVLVFNPQSENPFEGLGQWDRDLTRAARRSFRKLLVAGRCDRGGLTVSRQNVDSFRVERNFEQYLETSALTGEGCVTLRNAIICNILWDEIPWTASPRIFKLLKETIIKLKDEGKALLRVSELKQQLEMRLPGEAFGINQLRAVVGLLAGPGVVWQLEFGDFILLQPERINAYAAAVIRAVRAHTDEIGCIPERRVLIGDLDYQDMERLPPEEEQIVLQAMHQIFIEHGLCLREPSDAGPLLIFPSYFRRERPELPGHPATFVSYQFSGPLDEIYATLIVRLHHTTPFDHDQLWRFAADFKTQEGKRVGLKMAKTSEGAAEMTVYFDPGIPDDTKVTFIRYVHDHLRAKDPNMKRIRHYVCSDCHTPVENQKAVRDRLSKGFQDIVCVACEARVSLIDLIERKFASDELSRRVIEMEEAARLRIDKQSLELILLSHARAVATEAGQIFRQYPSSNESLDAEIEFKDYEGKTSGHRIHLHLYSGDGFLLRRKGESFEFKNPDDVDIWQRSPSPVTLVVRSLDGSIRWMDVSAYLRQQRKEKTELAHHIFFDGEPFTALNLQRVRDRLFSYEGDMLVSEPMLLEGKELLGSYTVKWSRIGPIVDVRIIGGDKTIATTRARVVDLGRKAHGNSITTRDIRGKRVVSAIQFSGLRYALVIGEEPAGNKTRTSRQ